MWNCLKAVIAFQAGRILDRVITRECKRVREANPALQPGKVIMYEGEAWKILRTVQKFKFVLQRLSGGKQVFVWIINLEHCSEVAKG